eukprot:scaffold752_cov322-Pavlova_lutheri.AAC.23
MDMVHRDGPRHGPTLRSRHSTCVFPSRFASCKLKRDCRVEKKSGCSRRCNIRPGLLLQPCSSSGWNFECGVKVAPKDF